MTQRDSNDENADPEGAGKPRSHNAQDAMQPKNFYGSSQARQPLQPRRSSGQQHPVNLKAEGSAKPSTNAARAVGLDLDGNDSLPSSPEVETHDEIMIEDVQDTDPVQTYQPTTISHSAQGWPDVHSMYTFGHGQLSNALVGQSRNPGFAFGSAFRGWKDGANFARYLVDYQINLSFEGDVAAPAVNVATATNTPPPTKAFSYSQAAAASRSAQANSPQSQDPASLKLKTADLLLARPHPHAYFNLKTFAWTIIAPFPNHASELQSVIRGCPGESVQYPHRSTEPQVAHFYTLSQHAIDPKFILRPSGLSDQRSRTLQDLHSLGGPSRQPIPNPANSDDGSWQLEVNSPLERCWDACVCANCRNAFTVSNQDCVQSFFGRELCDRFTWIRKQAATEGKDEAVRDAIDYLWKWVARLCQPEKPIITDYVYLGYFAMCFFGISYRLYRRRVQHSSSGWALTPLRKLVELFLRDSMLNLCIALRVELFQKLGFRLVQHPTDSNVRTLEPPPLTPSASLALTRAFLEISIWSAHLNYRFPPQGNTQNATHLVSLDYSVQEKMSRLIGSDASEEYMPGPEAFINLGQTDATAYRVLGTTPEADNKIVLFAYRAQAENNSMFSAQYYEALKDISTLRGSPPELGIEIGIAASRGVYSVSEILSALQQIQIVPAIRSHDEVTGLREFESISEERIIEAFNNRRENIVQSQGTESDMKELRDAMQIIRKVSPSELLEATLMSTLDAQPAQPTFTEEEAYKHLTMTKETDDVTLCTAADFYVCFARLSYFHDTD